MPVKDHTRWKIHDCFGPNKPIARRYDLTPYVSQKYIANCLVILTSKLSFNLKWCEDYSYNFSSSCPVATFRNGSFTSISLIFLANSRICLESLLYLEEIANAVAWILWKSLLQMWGPWLGKTPCHPCISGPKNHSKINEHAMDQPFQHHLQTKTSKYSFFSRASPLIKFIFFVEIHRNSIHQKDELEVCDGNSRPGSCFVYVHHFLLLTLSIE